MIFIGHLKFAPFRSIIIGLVNLDTSATLMKRIKVCEHRKTASKITANFGKRRKYFFSE